LPFVRGEIDILFVTPGPSASRPDGRFVSGQHCFVSGYRAYREGEDILLDERCEVSHVVLAPFGSPITQKVDDILQVRDLTRNIVMRALGFAAVFKAMNRAQLITFLRGYMAHLYVDLCKQVLVDQRRQQRKSSQDGTLR
jgi:hypothetical protein